MIASTVPSACLAETLRAKHMGSMEAFGTGYWDE